MPDRPRGRPRAFDPETALAGATGAFLRKGYEGASVTDLTGAMRINKPSLYATFGDKAALYAQVRGAYGDRARDAIHEALGHGDTLEETLKGLFLSAVDVYAPKSGPALGCLIATTQATAAGEHEAVREDLARFLQETDDMVAQRLAARYGPDLRQSGFSAREAAEWITATTHTLAIRARAGIPRRSLRKTATAAARGIAAALDA